MKALIFSFVCVALSVTMFGAGFNKGQHTSRKKAAKSNVNKKQVTYSSSIFNLQSVKNTPKTFGVEVGFNVAIKKDAKKSRFTVGADGGYFFQKSISNTTYIKPNLAYNMSITTRMSVAPKIGLGLALNKQLASKEILPYQPYSMNVMASAGAQLNFSVYNSKKYNYNTFLRYEFASQANPFAAITNLLPGSMWHLGMSVNVK